MEKERYQRSRELWERSAQRLVGGVGGNMRGLLGGWRPQPLFFETGSGPFVWDVDGNRYIDYNAGYGPLILGQKPLPVIEAVKRALDEFGPLLGASHRLEIEASEKLCRHIPSFERVRYANSGSEAVMAALRLARVYTGREKILRFEGNFHGQSDTINFSSKPPLEQAGPADHPTPVPGSGGIPRVLANELVLCHWNQMSSVEKALAEYGSNIAAVICEPLPANCGVLEPEPGFLQFLRQQTSARGIVLIFDEIKSGFRIGLGGAQAHYGVTPDLTVISKAMAAGFPIAALGGRKELMDLILTGKVWQSATFHSNAIAMAACIATLNELERPGFYERLFRVSEALQRGLRDAGAEVGVPVDVQGVGPLFGVMMTSRRPRTYREVVQGVSTEQHAVWWRAMLDRGVLFHPEQLQSWYVSGAHGEAEIEETVAMAGEAFAVVKQSQPALRD
jgi:glutamate-1-semialdehyde 2,1-aminomutase